MSNDSSEDEITFIKHFERLCLEPDTAKSEAVIEIVNNHSKSITYAELNTRANQLAHQLLEKTKSITASESPPKFPPRIGLYLKQSNTNHY